MINGASGQELSLTIPGELYNYMGRVALGILHCNKITLGYYIAIPGGDGDALFAALTSCLGSLNRQTGLTNPIGSEQITTTLLDGDGVEVATTRMAL